MYFRACFTTASVAKINFITMYPVYDILLEQQFVYKLQSLPRPTRTREECPLILFPQSYDVRVFVRSNELLTQGNVHNVCQRFVQVIFASQIICDKIMLPYSNKFISYLFFIFVMLPFLLLPANATYYRKFCELTYELE